MNLKKMAVVGTVVLTIAISVLLSNTRTSRAAGPVCSVPGDYATIQGAVNDAGCTTINVAAGAYSETVSINRSVTINGAQTGNNDFTTRSANPGTESTVNGATPVGNVAVFTISAANVTINGFTIKNTVTAGAAMGITVSGAGSAPARSRIERSFAACTVKLPEI